MFELYTENIAQFFSAPHKFHKKEYKNDSHKIIECTPDIFKNICEMEQRRSKRTKNNIFLVEYNIYPLKKETNKKLLQILYQNLFETDVITKIRRLFTISGQYFSCRF
ncbi:MAG: hypothetical protein ACOC1K_07115 [Nanoarchaeota archaeon]